MRRLRELIQIDREESGSGGFGALQAPVTNRHFYRPRILANTFLRRHLDAERDLGVIGPWLHGANGALGTTRSRHHSIPKKSNLSEIAIAEFFR
jgi:hypothetical protein